MARSKNDKKRGPQKGTTRRAKKKTKDAHSSKMPRRDTSTPSSLPGPEPAIYKDLVDPQGVDRDATKVIERLTQNGYRAYLVGGGVRDLLLGREPKDFDIATDAQPREIRKLFRNSRIIGRRFRLAHIYFSHGKIIEVATFRKDPGQSFIEVEACALDSAEEGNPVAIAPEGLEDVDDEDLLIRDDNVFGEPHEDAIRRDFTFNGLFYDLKHNAVIDYVGGLPDLKAHILMTIGDPTVRFREDPVRILRAIKFAARLQFKIEKQTFEAMIAEREELHKAAPPRLFEETLRYLRSGCSVASLQLAWDSGALSALLPNLAAYYDDHARDASLWDRLSAVDAIHREKKEANAQDALLPDSVLVTVLLWPVLEEQIEHADNKRKAFIDFMSDVGQRMNIPRRLRDRMKQIYFACQNLTKGKVGSMPRRDYYAEAVQLFEIECRIHGREVPPEITKPKVKPRPKGKSKRRRRRRRKPKSQKN